MGRVTNYIRKARQQLGNRSRRMYRSRAMRVLLGILVVGAIVFPPLIPLVVGVAAAAVLLPVAASLIGPALPSRLSSLVPSFLRGRNGSSQVQQPVQARQQSQPSRRHDERHGKQTGDPLTDALVTRLRDNGLRVSTDWKEAKRVLNALPEKYNLLKEPDSKVYGFVYAGTTYVNPKLAKADVPVHEYTHIWAEVLRQNNPDEWRHIVELMKMEKDLWKKVSDAYPHLETDDEIADEVLATYSGIHGQRRLQEQCQPGRSVEDVFSSVLQALERFWKNVASFFDEHYESKEDIADRVLSDFLNGVNPLDNAVQNVEKLSDRMPLKAVDMSDDHKNNNVMTGELKKSLEAYKGRLTESKRELFSIVENARGLDMSGKEAYGAYFILEEPVLAVNDPNAPANFRLEEGARIIGMFIDRHRTVPGDYLMYQTADGVNRITSFGFLNRDIFATLIEEFDRQKREDRLVPIVGREFVNGDDRRYSLTMPDGKAPLMMRVFETDVPEDLDVKAMNIDHTYRAAEGWKSWTKGSNVTNIRPVMNLKAKDVIDRLLSDPPKFRYMILDRMCSDCKYAINWGDFHNMWMSDRESQIEVMKALYNSLPEKPEWISMSEIDTLDRQMKLSEQYTHISVAVPNDGDRFWLFPARNGMYYDRDGRVRSAEFQSVENRGGAVYAVSKDGQQIAFENLIVADKRHLTDDVRSLFIDRGMLRDSWDVDMSAYDPMPLFAKAAPMAVFKLTKGGKDIDMPVVSAVIDGKRVTRAISLSDFAGYFSTVDFKTGQVGVTLDEIAKRYLGYDASKRESQVAAVDPKYRQNMLSEALPDKGDRFYLPEYIDALSLKGSSSPTVLAVANIDGVYHAGSEDHWAPFESLSNEDQTSVLKMVDDALYSSDIQIIQNPRAEGEGTVSMTYYEGNLAREVYGETLSNPVGDEYPLHHGAKGYYKEEGKFIAFDNESKGCFVEEFYHAENALEYLTKGTSPSELEKRPEEVMAKAEDFFKRSVATVVERTTDPRAKALTFPQRNIIQTYLGLFDDEPQKLSAAGRIYYAAIEDASMKRVPSAWKADVRDELKDLAVGKVREEQSQGLKR